MDPEVDAAIQVDSASETDGSTGGLDASFIVDAQLDASVEGDVVFSDMELEDAGPPEPADAIVDAGAEDMLFPDMEPPPPPSIARISEASSPSAPR